MLAFFTSIRVRHSDPLLKILNGTLVDLPSPINFRIWWNFGSLLGLVLIIQLATGLFLAIHYTCDVHLAFASVNHIFRDVNRGKAPGGLAWVRVGGKAGVGWRRCG